MTDFRQQVDSIIERAIRSGKSTGNRQAKGIGTAALLYYKRATKGSAKKQVTDLPSYIWNKVTAIKQGEQTEERVAGTMLVLSSSNLGLCLEENKKVTFSSPFPYRVGETFPYHRVGFIYYLDNPRKGSIKQPKDFADASPGNWLMQRGTDCEEYADPYPLTDSFSRERLSQGVSYACPDTELWYKEAAEDIFITYVEDGFYVEKNLLTSEIKKSIYLSDLPDTANSGTFTFPGAKDCAFETLAPQVVRMLHVGNYAILQVLIEKRTCLFTADDLEHTCGVVLSAQGPDVKAFNSICVFQLLIINTLTEEMNLLESVDLSTWLALPPITIAGGYTDIQICKETGRLLVVSSDTTVSTSTLSVDYFDMEKVPTLAHLQLADKPTAVDSADADATQVGYSLCRVDLDIATLTFINSSSLHTQPAAITTLQGVAVTGGCRCLTFTQQPETFSIFLRVHKVGYKMVNKDWEYTPVNGDPTRYEYWQREVVALGVLEFQQLDGTELWRMLTTETGSWRTCGTQKNCMGSAYNYVVPHLANLAVCTEYSPAGRTFAIRSFWPQLEGTDGFGYKWPTDAPFNRSDFPSSGLATHLYETRFAECFFGNSSNKAVQERVYSNSERKDNSPPVPLEGNSSSFRNDQDCFVAFSVGGTTLFLFTGLVQQLCGRITADSQEKFTDGLYPGYILADDAPTSSVFINYVRDRGGAIMNALYFPTEKNEDWSRDWSQGTTFSIGSTYYRKITSGGSNFSLLQGTPKSLFVYFTRQIDTYRINIDSYEKDQLERKELTVQVAILGDDSYIDLGSHPDPNYPNDLACVFVNEPLPVLREEANGNLKAASIENKERLHAIKLLAMNALQ